MVYSKGRTAIIRSDLGMEKHLRNQGIDMQQAFSILPNQILLDNRLDNKAKIIWVYIQGKPKDWDFSAYRIGQQLNMSEKTVRNYLIELEGFGYLERNRKCTGRVEYYLFCPPQDPTGKNYLEVIDPTGKKAPRSKSPPVKSTAISNKDNIVIKSNICETEVSPFILENELEKMRNDKQRHIRIIAWYLGKTKLDVRTKSQLKEVMSRHFRYASKLTAWEPEQLARAHERMIESFGDKKIDWTLETLYKTLTK